LPSLLKSATATIGPNVASSGLKLIAPETGIVVLVTASWVTLVWVSTSTNVARRQPGVGAHQARLDREPMRRIGAAHRGLARRRPGRAPVSTSGEHLGGRHSPGAPTGRGAASAGAGLQRTNGDGEGVQCRGRGSAEVQPIHGGG